MLRANQFGLATYRYNDDLASLNPSSSNYVGDKSFTVHELPDDLGLGGDEPSRKGGSAGARLGCCNITPVDFDTWASLSTIDFLN